jgi:tetratricopeptide (TPR) repeat protein
MKFRFSALTLVGVLAPALALAAPTGTVILRNGTKFESVEYEVRGSKVRVTLRFGERVFDMSEIRSFIPETKASVEEESGGEDDGLTDWQTRTRLTPPESWVAAPANMPLVRLRMKHTEYDATLSVTARPASGLWQVPTGKQAVPPAVSQGIGRDLGRFFGKAAMPKIVVGKLFGCRVLRGVPMAATTYGTGKKPTRNRMVTELRFRRFGLEYGLTYSVQKADAGALKHDVRDVFKAFSFLPALAVSDRFYGDYARGFSLWLPSADWIVEPSVFHATRPLTLSTAGGLGLVRVQVYPGATDAEKTVASMFAKRGRASKHFKEIKQEVMTQRGYPIVRFAFEDFKSHGKKLQRYEGLAAVVQSSVLEITGSSSVSVEDANRIAGQVSKIIGSVELYDAVAQREILNRAANSLRYISQGFSLSRKGKHGEAVQRFSDAIKEDGNVAIAYYLRGLSQKQRSKFKEYEADLIRADELDSSAGYASGLGDLSRVQAADASKRGDWKTATTLFARSYSSSKSDGDLKKLLAAATSLWNQFKKAKDVRNGVSDMEKRFKRWRDIEGVHKFLAKVYSEAARHLLKRKQLSKAKSMASKLRKLSKKTRVKKYARDAQQIDAQIDRKR